MGYFQATYDNQSGHDPFNNHITIDTSMQKGKGVRSFLKGISRSVLPLIKKGGKAVGKAVGKEALRAGVNILDDITHEKPFKVMCNPNFNIFLNQDSNIYSKKKNSSAPPYT